MGWALFLACYATGGWEPGWPGYRRWRRTLDVDLLMSNSRRSARRHRANRRALLLIVIFAASGALEALVTATADSVRGLMGLAPGTATRVGAGGGVVNAAT